MRIIVFCSGNLDVGSGSEVRARLIAKGLRRLGAEIAVVATGTPKIFTELGIMSYLLADEQPWHNILEQAVLEFKPDIIYGITEACTDLVRQVGRKHHCKIAYDLHGIGLIEILELGGGHGSRLIRSWNSLKWLAEVPKADLVTVANPTLVPIIKLLNARAIPVIGMADTSKFSPTGPTVELGQHPHHLQVLYAGNFYKWQGIHLLVQAIPLVLQQDPNFEFTLLGSVGKRQALVEKWQRQLPTESVHFQESVNFAEIANYYRGADILMIPRPFMLSTYLALPQKITEYMLSERAIVATNLAPHRWALGSDPLCGILCRPNPMAIAQGILECRDHNLRATVAKNARARALDWFDHDKQCQTIYQALQNLLN